MELSTWQQAVPLVVAVILAIYVPGTLIAAAAGRRGTVELAALAPVVSLAIAGVGGVIAYPLGMRWEWWSYLMSCALVLVVVLSIAGRREAMRLMQRRLRHTETANRASSAGSIDSADSAQSGAATDTLQEDSVRPASKRPTPQTFAQCCREVLRLCRFWLPACAGVALAALTVALRLMRAVPSPEQVTQNYDSVFHDNVVARIMLTGQASSLHALPPIREGLPDSLPAVRRLGWQRGSRSQRDYGHHRRLVGVRGAYLADFDAVSRPCYLRPPRHLRLPSAGPVGGQRRLPVPPAGLGHAVFDVRRPSGRAGAVGAAVAVVPPRLEGGQGQRRWTASAGSPWA
jgi:hypothetical protein